MNSAARLARLRIDGERLWRSLMELASIGATANGGVCRLALTREDQQGRELFARWCQEADCSIGYDAIGNMFVRRAGAESSAPALAMGSHLDSQPTGGKFDGAYGVLAGLEVIRTLNDQRIETRAPFEICVWTNEEGARFAPAMQGSAVYTGGLPLTQALTATDANGIRLEQALRELGYVDTATPMSRPAAHIELHIEQGPVLEQAGRQIGVVTGVQGIRWYDVVVNGSETHAGPTPMELRKDPVQATVRLLDQCYALARQFAPDARVTIGELHAWPGSRNTVPGKVRFTLDIRHPNPRVLSKMDDAVRTSIMESAAGPCSVTLTPAWISAPVAFDERCIETIRAATAELGYSHQDIVSGAGHDSVNLSRILPAAMIFVPCLDGVSHNEAESISWQQAEAGANVLLQTMLKLDAQH